MKKENFIPFSKKDLVGHLAGKIGDPQERSDFTAFCAAVERIYHFQFHADLEKFKTSYACLDPDRTGASIPGTSPSGEESQGKELMEGIQKILVSANYREITRERVREAFGSASPWGLQLKVDMDAYELLSLHYREEYPDSSVKRSFLLKRKFEYSVFRHVVLVFQLKDGYSAGKQSRHTGQGRYRKDKVYLKLFKNVPTVDLEMLFPDTEIRIRPFDKLKVIFPLAIGAISSIYKIFSYLLGHEDIRRLWTQVGFWALVGGLFGVALKGFFSYRTTIEKYLKSLTESLYFQNLDNNSGVMNYILDEAEEEECKELFLGYYFLHFDEGRSYGERELDERIEAYFRDELGTELDFEIDDSIRKMRALNLMDSGGEILKVLPLAGAREELRRQSRSLLD